MTTLTWAIANTYLSFDNQVCSGTIGSGYETCFSRGCVEDRCLIRVTKYRGQNPRTDILRFCKNHIANIAVKPQLCNACNPKAVVRSYPNLCQVCYLRMYNDSKFISEECKLDIGLDGVKWCGCKICNIRMKE